MAGNKINTKKKEEKGKSNRIAGQSIEETEDLDFSLLRKPIHTSVTGFAQARKVFDLATEEVQCIEYLLKQTKIFSINCVNE